MLDKSTVRAIILALGMTLAGVAVSVGVARIKSADRYVTVKGVAERDVRADIAIWPLSVVGADNDLTAAHAKLTRSQGVFEIVARDQAPGITAENQVAKTVRVVSTVEYFLRD